MFLKYLKNILEKGRRASIFLVVTNSKQTKVTNSKQIMVTYIKQTIVTNSKQTIVINSKQISLR